MFQHADFVADYEVDGPGANRAAGTRTVKQISVSKLIVIFGLGLVAWAPAVSLALSR